MKIILIGFMGSGKSSVAKALGDLTRLTTLEMDESVLQKTNSKSMHEVFFKGGELLLRETEILIAKENSSEKNQIVSTGSGVIMNKIILDYLKIPSGKVVFLKASFETILSRLTGDTTRPLFNGVAEAKSLYDFREPLYLKYADHVVEVDNKTVDEIALELSYGK